MAHGKSRNVPSSTSLGGERDVSLSVPVSSAGCKRSQTPVSPSGCKHSEPEDPTCPTSEEDNLDLVSSGKRFQSPWEELGTRDPG